MNMLNDDNDVVYFEDYINSLPGGSKSTKQALGFIRTRVVGTGVFVKALVDPGNLFGSWISEELADKLHLQGELDPQHVGTAAKGVMWQ